MVAITPTPSLSLLDDPLRVQVTGLDPGQPLQLSTRLRGLNGQLYESTISINADENGVVSVETSPTELDFFTQIKPIDELDAAPESFPNLLLIGKNDDGEELFCELIERTTADPGLTVEEVTGEGYMGKLCLHESNNPRPGILVLGGSGGGFPPAYHTELLASHGYTVLGAAYFGVGDLPETLTEIPVENVENALSRLHSHETTTNSIGIMCGSRGTELGQLLAVRNSVVDCLVGYAPSGIVWESAGEQSAWKVGDSAHPFLTSNYDAAYEQDAPIRFDNAHRTALDAADEETIEEATIPIEESDAAFLLVSGGDDQLWPSATFANRIIKRLDDAEFSREYEHICYPGAGHLIKQPFLPAFGRESGGELPDGRTMAFGGNPTDYVEADYDSWQHTLDFFDRQF